MPAAAGPLDWLADATLIFDEAGMLLSANAPAERLFGFCDGELAGAGWIGCSPIRSTALRSDGFFRACSDAAGA